MREEIYQWIKNLAVFYILFTALLHLLPNEKYERYVRFFMGLLLILMLGTPLFSLLGKSGALMESFQANYWEENYLMEQEELKKLQEMYLQKGYQMEIKESVEAALKNIGIVPQDIAVHIEGEALALTIYMEELPGGELERRIGNELEAVCQIREDQYQIKTFGNGEEAVGSASPFRASSGSDGPSGVR